MKKSLVPTVLAFALVATAPAAFAASSATANLGLSATVINNCTISTTPVAFGNYDPLAGPALQANGTLVITCTKLAPITNVSLGNGLYFATNRKMKDSGVQTMDYEIFQPSSTAASAPCAYTQRWGTTGAELFIPTPAPSKAARTYNVCGQVTAGQDLAANPFNDTVVATINF